MALNSAVASVARRNAFLNMATSFSLLKRSLFVMMPYKACPISLGAE